MSGLGVLVPVFLLLMLFAVEGLRMAEGAAIRRESPAAPPNDGKKYLSAVRQLSCYDWLRGLHGFITGAAILACIILWVVLLNVADNTPARIYGSVVCVALIVGLIIEYGLFTLLVDAADVLVDMGRRMRDNGPGRQEPPAAGGV